VLGSDTKRRSLFSTKVIRGVYRLEALMVDDVDRAKRLMVRYEDLRIGLADASVVVLAARYHTLDLLCTDERHFRALRGHGGKPFRLLPYNA
jgi:predicted nucleic acid-binding protein